MKKNTKNNIGIKAIWNFKSIEISTGKILKEETKKNLIVNTGLNLPRNWFAGDAVNPPSDIAIGEGSTPVANGDTALETPALSGAATVSKPANYQVQYMYEFLAPSGSSYSITEAGLFDNATTMFSHILTGTTYPVTATTSLLVTVTVTFSRS